MTHIELTKKALDDLKKILLNMLGDAFYDLSEEDIHNLGVRFLKITHTIVKKTS